MKACRGSRARARSNRRGKGMGTGCGYTEVLTSGSPSLGPSLGSHLMYLLPLGSETSGPHPLLLKVWFACFSNHQELQANRSEQKITNTGQTAKSPAVPERGRWQCLWLISKGERAGLGLEQSSLKEWTKK